jgi:hypothetical protein
MDAFEIDAEYDREHSDDGVSRYGAYVRDRMSTFAESWTDWDDGTVPFACTAWRTATGPVMAPGYVRRHQRILSAQIVRNEWDGSLAADVSLVIFQPPKLRFMRAEHNMGIWRDWPTEHDFGRDATVFLEPSGEDVIRSSYLMTSARLCFSMPDTQAALPLPAESWARGHVAEEAARQAVAILVRGLNEIVGPVLQQIEEG